jgi:hypothetical protein
MIDKITENSLMETDLDQSGDLSIKEFTKSFNSNLYIMELPKPFDDQIQSQFNELDTDKS